MGERTFFLPVDTTPPTRIAVYAGDLIDIADEDVTSASPAAQPLRTESAAVTKVSLAREEAAWLRDVLIGLDLGPAAVAVTEPERTPEYDGTHVEDHCPDCSQSESECACDADTAKERAKCAGYSALWCPVHGHDMERCAVVEAAKVTALEV